jgi:hypothetical protein
VKFAFGGLLTSGLARTRIALRASPAKPSTSTTRSTIVCWPGLLYSTVTTGSVMSRKSKFSPGKNRWSSIGKSPGVEAEASNVTGSPASGDSGLTVRRAVGGTGAASSSSRSAAALDAPNGSVTFSRTVFAPTLLYA